MTGAVAVHARGGFASRVAWSVWSLDAVLAVASIAVGLLAGSGLAVVIAVVALAFATVGALIVARHPGHLVGWLFCAVGLVAAADAFANAYALEALVRRPGLPLGMAMAWLDTWVWLPIIGLAGPSLLQLFPEGRPVSPRWRPVLWVTGAALVVATTEFALAPGGLSSGETALTRFDNPLGLPGAAGQAASDLGAAGTLVGLAFRPLGIAATAGLLLTSLGALAAQVRMGTLRSDGANAVVAFVLCTAVLVLQIARG